MKRIVPFLRPYFVKMGLATMAIGLATVCNLLLPTLMSDILNNGVYRADFDYILICCVKMLLVALGSLGGTILGSYLSSNVVAAFTADLRGEVFRKVHTMTFEEFGGLGTAALVTRATHDVSTLSWVASELCGTVITMPILFVGGVVLTFLKDWVLGLVLLATIPVIFAVVLVLGRKIMPLWEQSDVYIDQQNDIMRQRLRGIRVIRAFRAEPREQERIADATRVMSDYIIRGNVAMGLISPLASLLLNWAMVVIVWLGGRQIELHSGLTGGDIFAIVQYVALVTGGIIMAAFAIVMLPQAMVAARRTGQVLDIPGRDGGSAGASRAFSGAITMENATFSYEGAAEPALDHISLTVAPGEKVAVIGGTGSGKSTLVSLLMGFRMPTGGVVSFDGSDTKGLRPHDIRENISCVLQNSSIYSGTIRENVAMGHPGAGSEELWQALEIAQAADFVHGYPEGLDHEIRQSGKNLSGGQKQRLSIARAVLKEAPIYIFDDSFSALDFLTESRLRAALAVRLKGKTQIIITQRVSSAMHCDRFYVLDHGALEGSGSHRELLTTCRVYREIFESQTGGTHEEE